MGYSTHFEGQIEITPPLNEKEIEYLEKFRTTRRMKRKKGPYFVDGTGLRGQGYDDDITNFNSPPEGQPGLWCKWEVTEDGRFLQWDGEEKFYSDYEWMEYLINHFLKENAEAKHTLPFLQCNHVLNGTIISQGEEVDDTRIMEVKDNVVNERVAKLKPVGAPVILNKDNVFSLQHQFDPGMYIDSHLKITGHNQQQIDLLDSMDYVTLSIPEEVKDTLGNYGKAPLLVEIQNSDDLFIFMHDDFPILESIYVLFENLFNKKSPHYNKELDMGDCFVDGHINIKNTYYQGEVDKGIAVIMVSGNQLMLHHAELT